MGIVETVGAWAKKQILGISYQEPLAIPDLSELGTDLILKRAMHNAFGLGIASSPARPLVNNLARLIVAAVVEYQMGRKAVALFLAEHQLVAYFLGITNFENSITLLHRALRHIEVLSSQGLRQPDGAPVIPRHTEVLRDTVTDRIRGLRDAIAHREGDILGCRPLGGMITLETTADALRLDTHEIKYDELARWLKQVYKIALALHAYKEP